MSQLPPDDPPAAPHATPSASSGDDLLTSEAVALTQLRAIVLREDRGARERLEQQVQRAALTSESLSALLPTAVNQSAGNGPELAEALGPTLSSAFQQAVKNNPQSLVDAISPIMGPAIRQYIAQAIRGMVESLNQTVEQSLSVRSLGWRWQAWTTGRSFGEIVLLNSLIFRVEQVFLIHKESGLLLQHLSADGIATHDPDLISAMLTAIQDFVKDSFGGSAHDTLRSLTVGDRLVWVEAGPLAAVACVIQGHPPAELRDILCNQVDALHRECRDRLMAFTGDSSSLQACGPYLQPCLRAQYRDVASPRKSLAVRLAIAALPVVALAALGWWTVVRYQQRTIRSQQQVAWQRLIETIDAQPGVVVTRAVRVGNRFMLQGLRDPIAADPQLWVDGEPALAGQSIEMTWSPYSSLEPSIVDARIRRSLQLPADVRLAVDQGAIKLSGHADRRWVETMTAALQLVPGVRSVDTSQVSQRTPDHQWLLDALHHEPGYVVIDVRQELATLHISGLRDPLARPLHEVLRGMVPANITWHWESYDAQHAPFVLTRVRQVLAPPSTIRLDLQEGQLRIMGRAPQDWWQRTEVIAPWVRGVTSVDRSQGIVLEREELAQTLTELESQEILFEPGSEQLIPGQEAQLDRLATQIQTIMRLAATLRLGIELQVIGYSAPSDDITPSDLAALQKNRAETAISALVARQVPRSVCQAIAGRLTAHGEPQPPTGDLDDATKAKMRRVTFRVQTW